MEKVLHPTHCFCQISTEELQTWAIKRYTEHRSTMELLQSTHDPHQKEIISIVALFDVDDATVLKMMGDVDLPDHHIVHCRHKVKKILGLDAGEEPA